jgi:hypothetical protein
MSTYQSAYTGIEIDAAVGSIKVGTTNPTPSTPGSLGQLYRNTENGLLFKCVKVDGLVYTWIDYNGITISTEQPEGGIWLEEVV